MASTKSKAAKKAPGKKSVAKRSAKGSAKKTSGDSAKSASTRTLAALDLGSNSFHLVVANYANGRLATVDKIKEMVRLAEGLDDKGDIASPVIDRAIDCLNRFGERLRALPSENIRIVGTNTLRKAGNSSKFLKRAQRALGHPIEIISGSEEARLIFMGVSNSVSDSHKRRLVLDIGGGSTELILGKRYQPSRMDSLYMGCVSLSQTFFGNGKLEEKAYDAAVNQARQQLESVQALYRKQGWDTAIGASGTILAAQSVLEELDLAAEGITPEAIAKLKHLVLEAKNIDNLVLPGLGKDRAPVFPGGLAIIDALLKELRIEHLRVSDGALREGLLHELVGRVEKHDIREDTVQDLARRYHVDLDQAERVRASALNLFDQVASDLQIDNPELRLSLGWAATLHEIGLDISHSQYHKHGSYLLSHMDMHGFSRLDQLRLGTLVRLHRRKIVDEVFPSMEESATSSLIWLVLILRLACLLNRSRSAKPLPELHFDIAGSGLALRLPPKWLTDHPLTELDLAEEIAFLKSFGIELAVELA